MVVQVVGKNARRGRGQLVCGEIPTVTVDIRAVAQAVALASSPLVAAEPLVTAVRSRHLCCVSIRWFVGACVFVLFCVFVHVCACVHVTRHRDPPARSLLSRWNTAATRKLVSLRWSYLCGIRQATGDKCAVRVVASLPVFLVVRC